MPAVRVQYAALPFRQEDGRVQVMLVTSRETRRWVIPKGWPNKREQPHRSAEREAFEEAGIVGRIQERPIGSYDYEKRLKSGATIACRVEVFPLAVKDQRRRWPEYKQRQTRWFDLAEAATSVQERELSALIASFAPPIKP